MNGDEKVGYAARSGEKSVQSFARKPWKTETTCKIQAQTGGCKNESQRNGTTECVLDSSGSTQGPVASPYDHVNKLQDSKKTFEIPRLPSPEGPWSTELVI